MLSYRSQLILLSAFSGIAGFASFPRLDQGYLAWVALVPLLLAVAKARRARDAFLAGLTAGVLQWAALLVWIPRVLVLYGGVPAAVAWLMLLLLAVYMALFGATACALTRYCMKCDTRWLMLFPWAWVSLELMRTYCILDGFPWLLVGYTQTSWLPLIQVADLSGVFGVTFLVVWINAAIAWLWIFGARKAAAFGPLLLGLALVAACLAYGQARLKQWHGGAAPYHAAILQGNLAFEDPYAVLAWKFRDGYLKMADALPISRPDLLVLPETPAPCSYQHDSEYRSAMAALARRTALGMVLSNIHHADTPGNARYFNSAYFLDANGQERARYDKIRLVPFGEYVPWRSLFFFADAITQDVGAFHPGRSFEVVTIAGHPMSAIICFEAIFPQLARRFAREGSGLLINLTNDQWYGASAAPYQHFQMVRWRAVENRRYVIRAANSGISAIIEPTGDVQTSTGLRRAEVCVGKFSFLSSQTFYSRHGDWFAALCAIITAIALGWCARKRGRRGRV